MALTVILPPGDHRNALMDRLAAVLPPEAEVTDRLENPGEKVLLAAALDDDGMSEGVFTLLRQLRRDPRLLEGRTAGLVLTGQGELYTKSTARTLALAANMAGSRAQRAPQAAPLAQLIDVVTGDVLEITRSRCTVGRERAAADVVLRDPNVSRRHAELTFTGSDWSIEDLNSTNGTLVNNRRITRCPLRDGDLLTFGLSTFEFRG